MGPLHELVLLAESQGMQSCIVNVMATADQALVACDLQENGTAKFRRLPEGTSVRGFPKYSRTGNPLPRPFRDDARYTLEDGVRKSAYVAVVEKMVKRHPRSKALAAFLGFLRRKAPKTPAWLDTLHEEVKTVLFVPFFNHRPVFEAVADDLETQDPYVCAVKGRTQPDLVTGEPCVVPVMRPIRILRCGDSSGTTFMSVEDETTWKNGIGKSQRHLLIPMGEKTMHLHVAGLQSLIDADSYYRLYRPPPPATEGTVRYFAWSRQDPQAATLLLSLLEGELSLDELEQAAKSERSGDLCVLGVIEGRRLQFCAWHFLPSLEALQNMLAYGRRRNRNGKILGIYDLGRACVPASVGDEHAIARRFPSAVRMAVVDHILEGTPFPLMLATAVRTAYKPIVNGSEHNYLTQTQEILLEN